MLDILIKNGIITDLATGKSRIGDVGIRKGRIVDLSKEENQDSADVIDASGCYVTPGIIDFHAHLYTDGTERGVYVDSTYFPNGVTTAVDGGSAGVANYPLFYQTVVAASKVRIFSDLNLCSLGLGTISYPENIDPETVDVEKIKYYYQKYRDNIQALKLRQTRDISRGYGLEPLRLMRKIADDLGAYMVVHVTDSPGEVSETLELLKEGDVFCHVFHGKGRTILDERGKVLPEIWEARERGVLFDAAHGGNQFSNRVALSALEQGFVPDFVTSDISLKTMYRSPLYSMGMVISKFLNMGIGMEQLISMVTRTPARKLGLEGEIGTLEAGACADVAVLKIIEKQVEFDDSHGVRMQGNRLVKTQMTIREGVTVFRQIDF
ncbi:MAG: metallo-dependent hydrolase [Lachnospiraceae bacterium]|nr:metallo-dependent hydrolase [Lachnospiraceae bacterium]